MEDILLTHQSRKQRLLPAPRKHLYLKDLQVLWQIRLFLPLQLSHLFVMMFHMFR